MKRFHVKDMLIGFLLGVLVIMGLGMAAQPEPKETFSTMIDIGNDHYYIMTNERIYHVKIKYDRVVDTSHVAKVKDLHRDVVIRYD